MKRNANRARTGLSRGLQPVGRKPFSTEEELQELIAKHPELLDGEPIQPDEPRRWILVTREKGISDSPEAGPRWPLHHLIVDQDARPTLVEVKQGKESRNAAHRRRTAAQ